MTVLYAFDVLEADYDDTLKNLCMVIFFTSVGFQANIRILKRGGVGLLIIWAGAHLIEADKLMIGDMLAYLQYAMHVIMSFMFDCTPPIICWTFCTGAPNCTRALPNCENEPSSPCN